MAVRLNDVSVEQEQVNPYAPCECVMTIRFEADYDELSRIMVAAREFFSQQINLVDCAAPRIEGGEVAYEVD